MLAAQRSARASLVGSGGEAFNSLAPACPASILYFARRREMSEKDWGSAVMVALKSGGHALVSSDDLWIVQRWNWRVGANGYVYKCGGRLKGITCLMHRAILSAQRGTEVHHINKNKLDNRRENLEVMLPGDHQKHHHSELLIERNKARRIYGDNATCPECGKEFKKHPNHRGRQRLCSKLCSILKAVKIRVSMLEARKK